MSAYACSARPWRSMENVANHKRGGKSSQNAILKNIAFFLSKRCIFSGSYKVCVFWFFWYFFLLLSYIYIYIIYIYMLYDCMCYCSYIHKRKGRKSRDEVSGRKLCILKHTEIPWEMVLTLSIHSMIT